MFKVSNRNSRTRCELCSKLSIKTPERRQWRRSSIFINNFEYISYLVLECFYFNVEQVNTDWAVSFKRVYTKMFNNVSRVGLHEYVYYLFDSVCHVDITFSNTAMFLVFGKTDYREHSSELLGGPPHSSALDRICKLGLTR